MITLTEKAIIRLKEFADSEDISSIVVRTKVVANGCAGFSFDLAFDSIINDTDEVIEIDEIKVVIDMLSAQYMSGITIDFIDSPFSAGFKFVGGDIKGSCGCGNSVGF